MKNILLGCLVLSLVACGSPDAVSVTGANAGSVAEDAPTAIVAPVKVVPVVPAVDAGSAQPDPAPDAGLTCWTIEGGVANDAGLGSAECDQWFACSADVEPTGCPAPVGKVASGGLFYSCCKAGGL